VTGHEHDRVEEALAGRAVQFAIAEDYAQGLSASLKAGLQALPEDIEGFMVCLGDMPLVSAAMLDRLMAAFDPEEGRAIVMPTFRGKQGNPMLWSREFLPEMLAITGDVGARHLAGKYADRCVEVEMADDAVLRDFDTTEASDLARLDRVADFRKQGFCWRRRRRGGCFFHGLRCLELAEHLHHPENGKTNDHEFDDGVDEFADSQHGSATFARCGQGCLAFAGDHDEQVGKIHPAHQQAEDRVEQILHHGSHNGGKGSANHHANGKINHIAAHDEGLEFLQPLRFLNRYLPGNLMGQIAHALFPKSQPE
jgi:molybdenum cofactor cytidylyltransferase